MHDPYSQDLRKRPRVGHCCPQRYSSMRPQTARPQLRTKDIAFVVYPDHSLMEVAVAIAFEVANSVARGSYELHFVSEAGGKVRVSCGMTVESEPLSQTPFHTLIVGGPIVPRASTPRLIDCLRSASTRQCRIAAISTGVFLLAEAGLLDHRAATTHWTHARQLQAKHPLVKLRDCIYINDGAIWTTAGGAACLDLSLALIELDHGPEFAKTVARELVIYHRRSGSQSQFSNLLELSPKSDRIQAALAYARDNLHKPLTVSELAEVAHLSTRQFSRAFRDATGQSPAKAIELLRIEGARNLIERSRHQMDVVARQTGFNDRDHMRRAFLREFGQPPQALRRMAR